MKQLNPRQLEAVTSISRPTLVLAGAGSGKTSVITEKIAYLIRDCGFSAKHIAAVTFTNKAAREMKERVTRLLDKKQSRGLLVATFHTLGLTIIRNELSSLGLREGFSIFDAEDSSNLLKEIILNDGNFDADMVDFVQHTISSLKNNMLRPEQAMAGATCAQEESIAYLYSQYQSALNAYNAVDFDDLINLPVFLLRENPLILARWQSRLRYLLVDEYQDTNASQYALVKLLVGERHGLTVVGDDDQSIYAWRGAKPENLALLQDDFPHLKLIKLEQNYRSTSQILTLANTLIANNPHIFEKQLWSQLQTPSEIKVMRCATDKAEAEKVASAILHQRLKNQYQYKDFAVLYRGNHQSRVLEMALQQAGLPYKLTGGTSFFSRSEVKDIFAYLKLLANPNDDNSFLRIINVPRRKIGSTTLQALANFAQQQQSSLFDAIALEDLAEHVGKTAFTRLNSFYDWLQQLMRLCETDNPITSLQEMVEDIGYEAWLQQTSASTATAQKRLQNVYFLLESLEQTLQRLQEDDIDAGLKEAIQRLMLRDMLERQEDEDEDDNIQLLTLHASKGLEFPNVFMIGMEEELLPHRSSIEQDTIEEERRLCYVGITRAKQHLTLSYAAKRKQFGEVIDTTFSRFLDELPLDLLEWPERKALTPEQEQEKIQASINNLNQLLGINSDDF